MPAAALSMLHGAGFYAVYQPLHDLGGWFGLMPGTDGPDVPWISAGLTLATLGLVFGWVRRLWDDEGAGLWAVALLAGWPLVLRLGVTESMYVPAVFFAVASLSAFERYLRGEARVDLLLGLSAALVAVQTRAELMLLLPLWVGLQVVLRRPSWVARGVRDPWVWLGLAGALLGLLPRLHSLWANPPPESLQRAGGSWLDDPRLPLLVLAAVGLVWGVPAVRRRVQGAARVWLGRGVVVGLGALAVALVVHWIPTQGPTERTWVAHALFHGEITAPWWLAVAAVALGSSLRAEDGRPAALGLGILAAWWLYLPQYDSFSTFVRTGLSTAPLLAAFAAPRLAERGAGWAIGWAVAGTLWGLPFLSTVWPKQAQHQVAEVARGLAVAEGLPVVALTWEDLEEDLRAPPFHASRLRIAHHLGPRVDVVSAGGVAGRGRAAGGPLAKDGRLPEGRAGHRWTGMAGRGAGGVGAAGCVGCDDGGEGGV